MRILSVTLLLSIIYFPAFAQTIREYTVNRTRAPLQIDGQLTEPDWIAAPLTESFVGYTNGTATRLNTQAKMLWDNNYLDIGFICEDPAAWGTFKNRDDYLWNGEVVEISSWNQTDSRGFHVPEKFGRITFSSETGTSVTNLPAAAPEHFCLRQNYPNPFNPATTIYFEIPQPAHVSLKIFDLAGREIVTLLEAELAAGSYHPIWCATDAAQNPVAGRVYFIKLEAGGWVKTNKLFFLR